VATVFTYFTALYAAVLVIMVGSGLHGTLLSVRLTAGGGLPPQDTGWVMAGFYAGLVAGTFVCPAVIRRAGHARAFSVFTAVNTAVILLHALCVSPAFWGCCGSWRDFP
jgi:MFS family permease